MRKVLFTAKIDSHIIHFHLPYLKMFKELGYEVHVASEGKEVIPYADKKYDVTFGMNPISKETINSYKRIKGILEENEFEIIHTHTAIASVVTRLAASKVKNINSKQKVIYTAHGFHFMKGGPILNWILYFPIEILMGHLTDDLITINKDDYDIAKKYNIGKRLHYIEGVGVDIDRFRHPLRKYEEKKKYIITYVAELNRNKNQILLLNAARELSKTRTDFTIQIVGQGELKPLQDFVKENNLIDNVDFLGYRTDIPKILANSDIAITTSMREGLPLNVIESMVSGLPIIATNCRGHNNLVVNNVNGFLVDYNAIEISKRIIELLNSSELRKEMGNNSIKMAEVYSVEHALENMKKIYFSHGEV